MSGLDADLKKIREGSTRKHSPPPAPQVPHPWRARWDNLQYLYVFENEDTGKREWEIEEVRRRAVGGDCGDEDAKPDVSESGQHGEGNGR
ncbi:hypothetical protein LTR37_003874 [Vermiconidia calcicola]|uniref:Uncharacterized protein n=1 Tax=Vermiconidia calcicola TaxID=1690605 RepID=A0ACC3NP94_9PEZI|nr:hypothetical protein LTR37_003874 [Vermiconidia calcicola]